MTTRAIDIVGPVFMNFSNKGVECKKKSYLEAVVGPDRVFFKFLGIVSDFAASFAGGIGDEELAQGCSQFGSAFMSAAPLCALPEALLMVGGLKNCVTELTQELISGKIKSETVDKVTKQVCTLAQRVMEAFLGLVKFGVFTTTIAPTLRILKNSAGVVTDLYKISSALKTDNKAAQLGLLRQRNEFGYDEAQLIEAQRALQRDGDSDMILGITGLAFHTILIIGDVFTAAVTGQMKFYMGATMCFCGLFKSVSVVERNNAIVPLVNQDLANRKANS